MHTQNYIHTTGIKYAGSKLRLLPHIFSIIENLPVQTVLDGFSGSTRVSQALAQKNYRVISNDISDYSYIFAQCFLLNHKDTNYFQPMIDHLNQLPESDGWFTQHYGGDVNNGSAIQRDGTKKPWQRHNTQKLDAIRPEIDKLVSDPIDKAVLLASLMLALDEVDNTLGHFSAYLKEWSKRSYKTLQLKVPPFFELTQQHNVLQQDIFTTITQQKADLAYFDPPYGSNNEKMPSSRVRYTAYYHLWETICKNDQPAIFGAAGRRIDSSDKIIHNPFEDFRKNPITQKYIATEAIDQLIAQTNTRYIVLSYSSGGKSTAKELNEIINQHGKLKKTMKTDYRKNIMAQRKWTNQWLKDNPEPNQEYLFLLEKF